MDAHPELATLTLAEASRRIAARELSPVEITRATLERIEALNGHLAAYITVPAELALGQAAEAEREIARSGPRSPLHGIPVALKDNIATAGVETTAASEVLRGWMPGEDATCWARQREAGAVLAGKTLLHEFAIAGSLWSAGYGAARNPWDLARSTNGSSSGSAAAVAAGLAFAALGTETGASVRRPAAFCGLVGLLGSFGRVSRRGVIVNSWSLDHVGPLARSVEDAALVLEAVSGADPADPFSAGEPLRGPGRSLCPGGGGAPGAPRRRLLAPRRGDGRPRRARARARGPLRDGGCRREARRARAAAHRVRGGLFQRDHACGGRLRARRGPRSGRPVLAAARGPTRPPTARSRPEDYLLALRARRAIGEELDRAFSEVDVIASPSTATAATPLDGGFGAMRDRPLEVGPQWHNLHRVSSLLGLPAVTLPCGRVPAPGAPEGLPVGLQLIGRRHDEATLLRRGRRRGGARPAVGGPAARRDDAGAAVPARDGGAGRPGIPLARAPARGPCAGCASSRSGGYSGDPAFAPEPRGPA